MRRHVTSKFTVLELFQQKHMLKYECLGKDKGDSIKKFCCELLFRVLGMAGLVVVFSFFFSVFSCVFLTIVQMSLAEWGVECRCVKVVRGSWANLFRLGSCGPTSMKLSPASTSS